MVAPSFWSGRRVLLTGHTGFKGTWMALWLSAMGAEVHGLALAPETEPSMFDQLGPIPYLTSHIADLRDPSAVRAAVRAARPSIVLHLAAQALVRRSYRDPVGTHGSNVMGTVHLLDALRDSPDLAAILVVTSDKVYENRDDGRRYAETDRLGGSDPYSASKAACELIVTSYRDCFFAPRSIPVATARAGNVIGGGDWSEDRLIPDIWRAARRREPVALRYPSSTRPWQHVLDPVAGYLTYVERLVETGGRELPPALNFGPLEEDPLPVSAVAERFAGLYGASQGWVQADGEHPPEKALLSIDAGLAGRTLGWRPRLSSDRALDWTARWYRAFDDSADMARVSRDQITTFQDMPE